MEIKNYLFIFSVYGETDVQEVPATSFKEAILKLIAIHKITERGNEDLFPQVLKRYDDSETTEIIKLFNTLYCGSIFQVYTFDQRIYSYIKEQKEKDIMEDF